MYVWTVITYKKDSREIDEISEPYISAEYAMADWSFKDLEWKHIEQPKFSDAVLEHWEAEDDKYDYMLESQHVNGSDDG